jgi:hypothetical protein
MERTESIPLLIQNPKLAESHIALYDWLEYLVLPVFLGKIWFRILENLIL